MKTSEINFKVTLDENNLPLGINWEADSMNESGSSKSVFIALWDSKENNTLKIDLWTKEMMIEEMNRFFAETFLSMADTYSKATGQKEITESIREFANSFAKKTGVMK